MPASRDAENTAGGDDSSRKPTAADDEAESTERQEDDEEEEEEERSFLTRLFASGGAPWIASSFIALVAAIATPVTTCIIEDGKQETERIKAGAALKLARQQHDDSSALQREKQQHEIRMDFFKRAIETSESTEYRASVLRFLRLSKEFPTLCEWANSELGTTLAEIDRLEQSLAEATKREADITAELLEARAQATALRESLARTKTETKAQQEQRTTLATKIQRLEVDLIQTRADRPQPPVPVVHPRAPIDPQRTLTAAITQCQGLCRREKAGCLGACGDGTGRVPLLTKCVDRCNLTFGRCATDCNPPIRR